MRNELPIPPAVQGSKTAAEILRVWALDGCDHVSLRAEPWDDPAVWGILLVDLARHAARAYEQASRGDYPGTLARIREGFDAEWDSPTDTGSGSIVDD